MADTDIQITEILYDTSSGFPISDVEGEWVELFNDGLTTVSLDGWTIQDGFTGVTVISPGFSLAPGQYGIVYNSGRISEADFLTYYGPLPAGAVLITHQGDGSDSSQWASMSNSGEQITLLNDSSMVIEQFTYPDLAAAGQSLELSGTDGAETFTVQSTPTPGAHCFTAGTRIATPEGDVAVEDLQIGEQVLTADGRSVPAIWIGRQTIAKRFQGERAAPVCIAAGALGGGLPHADLTVTADHGMVLGGVIINAAALVNGETICRVPLSELPERLTVYHVETEQHDVILANGAASETFLDMPGRMAFDNYQEYLDLYGADRAIRESAMPRVSSARMLPVGVRAELESLIEKACISA